MEPRIQYAKTSDGVSELIGPSGSYRVYGIVVEEE